jgi:phosphopantetheinyl transferase
MIKELKSESLHLPRSFGSLPGYRVQGIVRHSWSEPAQAAGRVDSWCCQCVDSNNSDAWDEVAAPYILREQEWKIWRRIPRAATRRRWMRGRVAAKDAVRLLLLDRHRLAASLETISIIAGENGQPQVACDALPNTGAGIFVSISHCRNSSVALAAERSEFCHGMGIDVAFQTDKHDGLAEGGFVAAETALLEDCPAQERADWLLRLWCAKEAVGKALGLGLMGNPLNYVVRKVDRTRGTVEVEINVKPQSAARSHGTTRMTAHVGHGRGMAFAVARLEEK